MDSFGSFAQCIVDGDAETVRGERKLRGFGFALSVAVQLGILIVLILVPILTPAMLPKLLSVVQVPVYRPPAVVRVQPIAHARIVTQPSYIPNLTSHPTAIITRPEAPVEFAPTRTPDVGAAGPSVGILGLPTQPPMPAAPREAAHAPLRVNNGVMEALLIHRVEPSYPAIARVAHVSGAVVLSAIIATDDTIQSLHVESGNALLVGAALDAVRQWRYKPTLLDGQPVEVQTLITVNFVLQ